MLWRILAMLWALLTPFAGVAQQAAKPRLADDVPPLPKGAIARLGNPRFVATGNIKAIAVAPDGKWIAAAVGADIQIWDADKRRMVREIKTGAKVPDSQPDWPSFRLAWSKNGKLLAVGMSTQLFVIHPHVGKQLWHWGPDEGELYAVARTFEEIRFLDDDRLLVVILEGKAVELWDVARAARVRAWKLDEEKRAKLKAAGITQFNSVTLSPSGRLMVWSLCAHGNPERSAEFIYETISGKFVRAVKNLRPAARIDLLDEGDTLLVQARGKEDRSLPNYAIMNAGDGKLRHKLITLPGRFTLPFLSMGNQPVQYGKSLLMQDTYGLTRWDPASGKLLDQWPAGFSELAVSADGKRLVAYRDQRLYVCGGDLDALCNDPDFSWPPGSVEFVADGRLLVKSHARRMHQGGRLTVWDPLKKTVLATQFTPIRIYKSSSVLDTWHKRYARFDEKGIDVIDQLTGRTLSHIPVAKDLRPQWNIPVVSADGTRVLTWEPDKDKTRFRIRWFDCQSGRELGRLDIPFRAVYPRASEGGWGDDPHWTPVRWYTPDGSVFGYTGLDCKLVLVSCATGKVERMIGFSQPTTWEAAKQREWFPPWSYASAGFGRFYFGMYDEDGARPKCVLWDRDGHLLRHYSLEPWLFNVISPDGRLVAGTDRKTRNIMFYETATGRLLGQLRPGAAAEYSSLSFSPDGKLLASTCADTTVLLWDMNRPVGGRPALAPPKTAKEADALWTMLRDADPAAAQPALWALVGAPEFALPLLKKRLQPLPNPEPKRVQELANLLDSAKFDERETATKTLLAIKTTALPILRAARKTSGSLEHSRRLDVVIAKLQGRLESPAACACELRALEVLERIGTTPARQQIAAIADGSDSAVVTAEAKSILNRWR